MGRENETVVVLLGPIGDGKKPPQGGYQACNRRTLNGLKGHNVRITILAYPESSANIFIKIPYYLYSYIAIMIKLCIQPKCIVHMTALYKYFVYIEFIFIILAKVKRNYFVYDIRAGSFIKYYDKFSKLYTPIE